MSLRFLVGQGILIPINIKLLQVILHITNLFSDSFSERIVPACLRNRLCRISKQGGGPAKWFLAIGMASWLSSDDCGQGQASLGLPALGLERRHEGPGLRAKAWRRWALCVMGLCTGSVNRSCCGANEPGETLWTSYAAGDAS
ncbi:unnamed protein product [Prunus armeniaca]